MRVVRRLTASTLPVASPTSTTSPTPNWSSTRMNRPARKSRTSACEPKPIARPTTPAPASSGPRSMPSWPRTMKPANVQMTTPTMLRSTVESASTRCSERMLSSCVSRSALRARSCRPPAPRRISVRLISRRARRLITAAAMMISRIASGAPRATSAKRARPPDAPASRAVRQTQPASVPQARSAAALETASVSVDARIAGHLRIVRTDTSRGTDEAARRTRVAWTCIPAVCITEYTDPGCPWAYSAEPFRRRLAWLYGDELTFERRLVGLAETPEEYEEKGFTPAQQSHAFMRIARDHGMPIDTRERPRMAATVPACRAVVAARLHAPDHEVALLRALRLRHFGGQLLDEPDTIDGAARDVGIDPGELARWTAGEDVERALRADMA